MSHESDRDLTVLEYMVLGLISIHPQSGYSIITTFESGLYRWSPSPGSVYPTLKRLEKQELLGSELEVIHETRPRKMYSLTPLGEAVLDEWLRRPLSIHEVKTERDIVLKKFLFIEKRFTHQEIVAWLDNYEQETEACQMTLEIPSDPELRNLATIHHELIAKAIKMEMEMQRKWIKMARRRLEREAGEKITTDQED
jgi:DNA-binding PadR family transcriptional regulator